MGKYISIPEFAKRAGCTKQYVYHELNGKFADYFKVKDGKKLIDEDAIQLVRQKSELVNKATSEHLQNQLTEVLREQLKEKDKQIEQYIKRIERLDDTIVSLNKALERDQNALINEQHLHAQARQELQAAKLQLEELTTVKPATAPAEPEAQEPTASAEPESQSAGSDDVVSPEPESAAEEPQTDQGPTDQSQESAPEQRRRLSVLERIRILFSGEV